MASINKLFISYSRQDKEWVYELHRNLKEDDYACWIDKEDLEVGKEWWELILDGIESSQCVLFILSSASDKSKYCQAELKYARNLNIPIIPIHLNQDDPIPAEFQKIQLLERNKELGIDNTIRLIERRLRKLDEEIKNGDYQRAKAPREPFPEEDTLLMELKNIDTPQERRQQIGWAWANTDKRPGVGLRDDGWPDLQWHRVNPVNEVTLHLNEEKTHVIAPVRRFWIARYPITHAQFRAFVQAADGYDDNRWWQGLKPLPPNHPNQRGNEPQFNVDWYECIAYSRWLSANLPDDAWPEPEEGLRSRGGYEIRLPTEWEWQLAATDNENSCIYPWGETWNAHYCNNRESGLETLVAVGLYPQGAAPCGALDMTGNISEWCLNVYETIHNVSMEAPAEHQRTIRGGSYEDDHLRLRVRSRQYANPRQRSRRRGFRLICSSK